MFVEMMITYFYWQPLSNKLMQSSTVEQLLQSTYLSFNQIKLVHDFQKLSIFSCSIFSASTVINVWLLLLHAVEQLWQSLYPSFNQIKLLHNFLKFSIFFCSIFSASSVINVWLLLLNAGEQLLQSICTQLSKPLLIFFRI